MKATIYYSALILANMLLLSLYIIFVSAITPFWFFSTIFDMDWTGKGEDPIPSQALSHLKGKIWTLR